jgi:hypothetical protein
MIERLLAVLAAADLEPDPRELRDALWLAGHIAIPGPTDLAVLPPREPLIVPQPAPKSATTTTAGPAQEPTAPAEVTTGVELYAAGSWGGGRDLRAMEARSPAVPALRHQLPLARALRPFKRRVPSRTSFVIDEAATAARVAEEGIWLPVLRPAPARWLDLALVVDTSPSMVVWRRTLAELRTLAERLGAFRIVRVLAVDASTDPLKPLTVRPGPLTGGPIIGLDREPATLIDPSRRQVILVVTDAVSGAWRDGRMDTLLRRWGAATPVAVATVLPQRMWAGTGIRVVPAQLHSPTPGRANGTLRARARSVHDAATGAVPIPVMELSARWLGQWAYIVAGAPDWRNAALLASPAAAAAPSRALPAGGSAAEMVRRFRTAVSPTAFQLACYLSAAWLNLPVMRLVQRVMLPDSDTAHLAEVFLGGLLKAVPTRDGMDPELVQYDFLPQVRSELNNYLLRDEMLDVLQETSQFVTERFGQPLDFAALLADPEGTPLPALAGEGGPPLAYVAATVLSKLGGRYRSLANRLATAGPAAAPGDLAPSSPDLSTPASPASHDAEPGAAGRNPEETRNLNDSVGTGVTQAEAHDASSPDARADDGSADLRFRETAVPQAMRRYLKVQYPESVAVGKPFSLLLSIVLAQSASAELVPLDVPPEGRDVLLVVHAPGVRLLSGQQQSVHVPADGDSRPVRFELRADAPGPRSVSVTAWLGGNYLGERLVEISAELDRRPGTHRDVFAEIVTEPTEGAVSLVVRYDPRLNSYRFEFRDEDYPSEVTSNLAYDPGPLVERLVANLDEITKGRSGYSAEQTRDYMVNAGAALWRQLIPAPLREQFWDRQHRIRQLTILSDRDAVPWELLYPIDPGHDAGFLVEQFPVMRGIFGLRPARRLRLQPARFVLPQGSPSGTRDEIDTLRQLLGPGQAPGEVISALTPLQELIRSGDFGLLHFACHNRLDPAAGSSITFGNQQFTPQLITTAAIDRVLARSAPIVFMNVCRSIGLTATYNRLDGWASKFLEAGAAAFIGSLWAVSDGTAREFAQELYGQLQAGSTLGEAVMRARQVAATRPDDPTWLAYSVYGDPRATISQR